MDEGLANHILDVREVQDPHGEEKVSSDGLPLMTSSAGYSIDSYLLLSVCDLLQQLITTLIAVNGTSPPRVKPMQRPVSALDRAKATRERSAVDETLADLGF
ncbi:hypothetical protein ACFRAQ_35115 [Nocardia sp. NPDC056611]|uniref:hypothetical protein n=1 Tax=Nocardia sp. NPDC056611 TaxID=3345877 RepID=UPI00366FCA98